MESGLEDRNNVAQELGGMTVTVQVSMESGLEDRNNRPKTAEFVFKDIVSMESGLEDRNNHTSRTHPGSRATCLNGVRPRRPEQLALWPVSWDA